TPHNPTGGVLTRDDIEAIADVAREYEDITILADEIYMRLIYEGEHFSIASLPGMAERTIVLDGFSKAYAMTGWRLGYAIVPPQLVEPYSKLIINSVSCTSSFEQIAAVEALTGRQDSVDQMAAEFRARRALVVEGLNRIPGVRCRMPAGAFYAFPNVAGTGMDGSQLADKLLYEGGVCVLSGTAFGKTAADHIRISYANSQENLRRALERFEEVVSKTPAPAAV
ncbi:MAG TPA: aminotransferase class I/II-fold pyridoxal phosphate-dependent enzyme, partial [Vicinamibacterales bacterium]|nr:aminotransferase class I/II-fold pyridoxal phosphate-dependent enzyme [Vicinamibacterales bacterium]